MLECPGQGQRQYGRQQHRGPVTQMIGYQIDHHEMVVDEIDLQTQAAKEDKKAMAPSRHAAEQIDEQQDERDRERNIDHPFSEERKAPMPHLLQPDTGRSRHQEGYQHQPSARRLHPAIAPDKLATVDAYKEYRYATPEDLYMANCLMHRHYPLHDDTPADHQHRQPAIRRIAADELHIKRRPEVEHHDGRHIPEGKFVVEPEAPIDGDVEQEV